MDKNIICFHDPDDKYGFLSNWYLSKFIIDDIEYSSVEQYMMYQKAIVCGDNTAARKILDTIDPSKIKKLGRSVLNYNDHLWSGVRQLIVCKGLYEKFSQNSYLKERLLNTGNRILAEAAVHDHIWGIGLSEKDPRALNMDTWNGSNLLGFTLMIIRDYLKEQE